MFWLDELICVAQMPNLMSLVFWVMPLGEDSSIQLGLQRFNYASSR
jgi:hypothetical protein